MSWGRPSGCSGGVSSTSSGSTGTCLSNAYAISRRTQSRALPPFRSMAASQPGPMTATSTFDASTVDRMRSMKSSLGWIDRLARNTRSEPNRVDSTLSR